MQVKVHTHRSSDSASSVFLRLTMYADPLAERVLSRLGGTHTSHSGTVGARPRKPLSNIPGIASVELSLVESGYDLQRVGDYYNNITCISCKCM